MQMLNSSLFVTILQNFPMSFLCLLVLIVSPCSAALSQVPLKLPAQQDNRLNAAINHEFTLHHIFQHGVGPISHIHRRLDITPDTLLLAFPDQENGLATIATPFSASSAPIQIQRLTDRRPSTIEPLLDYAFQSSSLSPYNSALWEINSIYGPKMDDKETIISLAGMAMTAYEAPHLQNDPDDISLWDDVSPAPSLNRSIPVGWEKIGLRGQVFVSETNDTVIIALKGTSPPYYPGRKETTDSDRDNDNLLFSCCCGDSKYLYNPVCSCASCTPTSSSSSSKCKPSSSTAATNAEFIPSSSIPFLHPDHQTCNKTCQVENLKSPDRYWSAAREIYTNVTLLYPTAEIWVTGHSLGGAMASLLGTAYGLPIVTFEAPGEAAAARRLQLPVPPLPAKYLAPDGTVTNGIKSAIYHIGHTADPIVTGTCTSLFSTCQFFGYFFETKCHIGNTCVYDTVSDLGWINWIGNHRMGVVIDGVLKKYEEVAECKPVNQSCFDCGEWDFYS